VGSLLVVDRRKLALDLFNFYNFKDKIVLYVGAGGHQILCPEMSPAKVVAIDSDSKSLQGFRNEANSKWSGIPIQFVPTRFEAIDLPGDVVYFEFCLHLMNNPGVALEHAHSLALEIVVMDHLLESEWTFYSGEEPKVLLSTRAIESFGIKRRELKNTVQRFDDYPQLLTRLSEQGEKSTRRILSLREAKDIKIKMDYALYLL
jgi:hypothetical protein